MEQSMSWSDRSQVRRSWYGWLVGFSLGDHQLYIQALFASATPHAFICHCVSPYPFPRLAMSFPVCCPLRIDVFVSMPWPQYSFFFCFFFFFFFFFRACRSYLCHGIRFFSSLQTRLFLGQLVVSINYTAGCMDEKDRLGSIGRRVCVIGSTNGVFKTGLLACFPWRIKPEYQMRECGHPLTDQSHLAFFGRKPGVSLGIIAFHF